MIQQEREIIHFPLKWRKAALNITTEKSKESEATSGILQEEYLYIKSYQA